MTPDEFRIIIQLSRRGLATATESIDPAQGIACWRAIAALQQAFADSVRDKKGDEKRN